MDGNRDIADLLDISYLLLIGLPALTALLLLVLGFACGSRSITLRDRHAVMIRALDLPNLAPAPSGSSLRNPEFLNPAVDLRPTPWLFPLDPDPAPGPVLRPTARPVKSDAS
jgi:hypothetical protein